MIVFLAILVVVLGAIAAGYIAWRWSRFDGNLMLMFYERFGHQADTLKGKIIWITGASSGIGEELALELADVGSRLILSGTQTSKLEQVKRRCLVANGTLVDSDVLVLPMDMTDLGSHQKKHDEVIKAFGHLDILVNNAGRLQFGLFEDVDIEVDRANFEVNVFGLINLTRLTVRHWLENRSQGHIAVTSSGYGKMGGPSSSTYSATKHALHGYFEALRPELFNRGIVVSMVCPGPVSTPLLDRSFSTKIGGKVDTSKRKGRAGLYMKVDRCAKLFAIALANQVSECWMMTQPLLTATYFATTCPNIFRALLCRFMTEVRVRRMVNLQL